MKEERKIAERVSILLTNERFELGYSEVEKKLIQLKSDGLIDSVQLEKIRNEDILLKIKYRTYKKCLKQIVIGLILIGIGVVLMSISSLRYLFIIGGIILFISSIFGCLSNRISRNQIEYLKK